MNFLSESNMPKHFPEYDELGPWQEEKEVIVESGPPPPGGGHPFPLAVRPVEGEVYAPSLLVSCSRDMQDPAVHPSGTRFRIRAKMTNKKLRNGGWSRPYLYSDPKDYDLVDGKPK